MYISTNQYSPTIFDDYDFREKSPLGRYISGMEGIEVAKTALKDLVEESNEASPDHLQSLLTAFCIELHAFAIFKEQFVKAPSLVKSIKACPVFLDKTPGVAEAGAKRDKGGDYRDHFKTSEGIAFYFRFLGQSDGGVIRKFTKDETEALKLGLRSSNHEIAAVSSFLLGPYFQDKATAKLKSTFPVSSFITSVNSELKGESNKILFRKMEKFKHFIILLNEINSRKEATRILMEENPSREIVFRNLQKDMENLLTFQGSFCEWENELKGLRRQQFEIVRTNLLKIRDQQKGKKIEFTKIYLKHDIDFVPIQIESYLKNSLEKFPNPIPAKSLSVKSSPSKSKPSPKKRIPKKTAAEAKKVKKPLASRTSVCEKELPIQAKKCPKEKATASRANRQRESIAAEVSSRVIPKVEFKYAPRVEDWFKAEPVQLKGKTYRNLPAIEQLMQKYKHGFPVEIEGYIPEYGIEKTYVNEKRDNHPDQLICVPGEMRFYFADRTVIERGVYNFCIGGDGEMYHRHFSKKTNTEIFDCAQNAFYNFDYPSLEKSCQPRAAKKITSSSSPRSDTNIRTSIDPITQALTLSLLNESHKNLVDFVLFKTG
jgi:hypothetical protein